MQDKNDRAYHHGDLRRVIIETAQAMLGEEKGWQFTLREVARRAGVSHAAPYKHFPDKSALLSDLATIGFDELHQEIASTNARPHRTLRAQYISACKAYIGFGTSNPSLYKLMFSADVDKSTSLSLKEAGMKAFAELLGIIARGQESGAFKKQPIRSQAAATWSLLHGFTMLMIEGQLEAEKVGSKPVDTVLAAMLDGLGA